MTCTRYYTNINSFPSVSVVSSYPKCLVGIQRTVGPDTYTTPADVGLANPSGIGPDGLNWFSLAGGTNVIGLGIVSDTTSRTITPSDGGGGMLAVVSNSNLNRDNNLAPGNIEIQSNTATSPGTVATLSLNVSGNGACNTSFLISLPTTGHVRFSAVGGILSYAYDLDTIAYNIGTDYYEFNSIPSNLADLWNDPRRDILVTVSGQVTLIDILYYADAANTIALVSNLEFSLECCEYTLTNQLHEEQYTAFLERAGWARYGTTYDWEKIECDPHIPWLNITTMAADGTLSTGTILTDFTNQIIYDQSCLSGDKKMVIIDEVTQIKYKIDPRCILRELYNTSEDCSCVELLPGRLFSLNVDLLNFLQEPTNYPLYFSGINRNGEFVQYDNKNNVIACCNTLANQLNWSTVSGVTTNPWLPIIVGSTTANFRSGAYGGATVSNFIINTDIGNVPARPVGLNNPDGAGLCIEGTLYGTTSNGVTVSIEFSQPVSNVQFLLAHLDGSDTGTVVSEGAFVTANYLDSTISTGNIVLTPRVPLADTVFNIASNHVKNKNFQTDTTPSSGDYDVLVNITGPVQRIDITLYADIQVGASYVGQLYVSNIVFDSDCEIGIEMSSGCHTEELAEILWDLHWIKPSGGGPYDWQLTDPQAIVTDIYSLVFVDSGCNVTTVVANSTAQNVPLFQRLGDNFCLENGKLLVVKPNGNLAHIDASCLYLGYENTDRVNRRGENCFPVCGPILQYSWGDLDCREFGWPGSPGEDQPGIVIRNRVANSYRLDRDMMCIVYQVSVRNTGAGLTGLNFDNYQVYHNLTGPGIICSKKVILLRTNKTSGAGLFTPMEPEQMQIAPEFTNGTVVTGNNLTPGQYICYQVTYYIRNWRTYPTMGDLGIYCYSSTASVFANRFITGPGVYHQDGDFDTNVLTVSYRSNN